MDSDVLAQPQAGGSLRPAVRRLPAPRRRPVVEVAATRPPEAEPGHHCPFSNRTWVCVRLLLNRPWWLNLTCRLAVLDDLADPGPNTPWRVASWPRHHGRPAVRRLPAPRRRPVVEVAATRRNRGKSLRMMRIRPRADRPNQQLLLFQPLNSQRRDVVLRCAACLRQDGDRS
jgi:hypothetical protein